MPFPDLLGLLMLGALFGFLGGLLGIGGGLFAIPVLAVLLNMDEQHAQGTSLVMVVPNVFLGLWNYARHARMDLRFSLTLAAAALPLTLVGAHFATSVPSSPLRIAFALFTLCIAGAMLFRAFAHARKTGSAPLLPWPFAALVGAFGGFLSGMFSVGGAIFAVPLMSLLFGFSQSASQGFALALVAPGTLAGLAAYARAGDVDWPVGFALAAGGILTVPYGVKLAVRLPERRLRLCFAGLMVLAALALILKS
jgi:uncharacterized membrane protein YfcA